MIDHHCCIRTLSSQGNVGCSDIPSARKGSDPAIVTNHSESELMRTSLASPVRTLADHSDLNCVDREWRGGLVTAPIVMQARDAASVEGRSWVTISEFMWALLPTSEYDTLQGSLPTCARERRRHPFGETFRDYGIWSNHAIRIED